MFFSDYSTFIYISLFIIVYNFSKLFTNASVVRNVLLLGGNLLILLTLVKEHTLIVLAVLSLIVFVSGKLIQRNQSKILVTFILVFLIGLFSIRNYPFVQDLLNQSYLSFISTPILSVQKLGLSYILFRFVHWIIESFRDKIQSSDFMTFLNYIFFFPSILAGPIDTYKNFQYWIKNTRPSYQKSLFFAGVMRVFLGGAKTLGLVPFIIEYATNYQILLPDHSPLTALSISLLAYSMYIYLDFSGYSDIAIGTAYMLGIRTPENFNNPYISTSLSEFWKRWHMTFSKFLKLYVFIPFIRLYNSIFNPKYRMMVTILCYLSTFVICGLWHGDKVNFVYWGVWHGIGLSLNKLFTVKIKPNFGRSNSYLYSISSVVITFIFVTVGWVFFHYSEAELAEIYTLIL